MKKIRKSAIFLKKKHIPRFFIVSLQSHPVMETKKVPLIFEFFFECVYIMHIEHLKIKRYGNNY